MGTRNRALAESTECIAGWWRHAAPRPASGRECRCSFVEKPAEAAADVAGSLKFRLSCRGIQGTLTSNSK